jgi:hypothetical protein
MIRPEEKGKGDSVVHWLEEVRLDPSIIDFILPKIQV